MQGNQMNTARIVAGDPISSIGGFALSGMVQAIKGLYHIAGEVNTFVDEHIEKLKASDTPLIASTGRVLEAAKYGFGLGYVSSFTIIAVGQYLLGNTLAAIATVATAVTLTNPIAMTCAAIGAIYYGWNALTDKERNQIIERLSDGLALGVELIRSMVEFVIRKTKDLMTSHQLEDVKEFVKTQAALFGKSLHEITHKFGDLVRDGVDKTGKVMKEGAKKTGEFLKEGKDVAGEYIKEGTEKFGGVMKDGVDTVGDYAGRAAKRIGGSKSQANASPPADPLPSLPNKSTESSATSPPVASKDQS